MPRALSAPPKKGGTQTWHWRKNVNFAAYMAQRLTQTQEQKLTQQQRLTQQQLLAVRMIEMPIAEFEQNVQAEIDDNPALEAAYDSLGGTADDSEEDYARTSAEPDTPENIESEERQSALDEALQNIGRDDEMPSAASNGSYYNASDDGYDEHIYGEHKSFYDHLREQVTETVLTPGQKEIMEYLIGSLDNDGLLRKEAGDIADELAVYHNISVSDQDVKSTLAILKSFDPAGIGAASLQECLLLQIERKPQSATKELMKEIISQYYDDFMTKHFARIASQLNVESSVLKRAVEEIQKLNPKPGAALYETDEANIQQITPDFIVETADDGSVSFSINKGKVPELHVSTSFTDMLNGYKANSGGMSRRDKEALLYAKQRVDRARGYIEAVRQRQATLHATMKAIIDIQHKYFASGDESDLKPMVLKDVALRTGLDISTVSRVCAVKYAQTRWGIFRLRHFFSEGIRGSDGEEMSTRRLKVALKEIVAGEDKSSPLSDDALCAEMKKRGYAIARRTISKYREQLGIPVARLRRQ